MVDWNPESGEELGHVDLHWELLLPPSHSWDHWIQRRLITARLTDRVTATGTAAATTDQVTATDTATATTGRVTAIVRPMVIRSHRSATRDRDSASRLVQDAAGSASVARTAIQVTTVTVTKSDHPI